jgi:hypothetical protein
MKGQLHQVKVAKNGSPKNPEIQKFEEDFKAKQETKVECACGCGKKFLFLQRYALTPDFKPLATSACAAAHREKRFNPGSSNLGGAATV